MKRKKRSSPEKLKEIVNDGIAARSSLDRSKTTVCLSPVVFPGNNLNMSPLGGLNTQTSIPLETVHSTVNRVYPLSNPCEVTPWITGVPVFN